MPMHDPTDDDVTRHLRPIRAEYVRKVREAIHNQEPKQDKDGCFKDLLTLCLLVAIISLLVKGV